MPATPAPFSDAASREMLRTMIRDGAFGRFDEKNDTVNEPIPHVLWRLLDQIETSEQLTAIVRDDARASLASIERQRDKAERQLQEERKLSHDLANRFSHASSALELIAKDLGIEHKEPPSSGWANPIWEGVRARKLAVADAVRRETDRCVEAARAVLSCPGVSFVDVERALRASPSPPAPDAKAANVRASRWAAHCCGARLIPTFFDTRQQAVEYLKAFECSPGEGRVVEHPSPPSACNTRGEGCDDCCGSGVAIDVVLGKRVERPCPYGTKRSGT